MFFKIANFNKNRTKSNVQNNQKISGIRNNQTYKTDKIKREKIIKINNSKNIEHQITNLYNGSYSKDFKNGNINFFFVRLYFESKNNDLLALQKNIWEFLNFIHSKIEKSFVLDPNNIQTFYSSNDNQIRIKIYHQDLNIKRIFINTCSNLFSNITYYLKSTSDYTNIIENFVIDCIKVTNQKESDILGIFENDTFIISDGDDLGNNGNETDESKPVDTLENDDKTEDETLINIHDDNIDKPNTLSKKYDFIIIGGSPGGIMTAYKLAKEYIDKKILIIESGEKTLNDFKEAKYNNTSKWWEASNDNNYKTTFTDIDNKVISQGKGLGGGSLHFGLQYIDHYDLINLDYKDWLKEFDELSTILEPQTYKYSVNENNTSPTKPHFDLLSELSKSQDMITYNNKVYCNNLKTNSRILYGNLISNLNNVSVRYNCKINHINFSNNNAVSCQTLQGEIFEGSYFIVAAGAIQTPIILQNSNIDCGNYIYDHCGISLLYDKESSELQLETKNIADGYSEEEIQKLNIPLLNQTDVKEMNTRNKMVAIISHTKLSDSEIDKATNGILPSYNIKLEDANSIKYVYDMGTYWLPFKGHPGGSLTKYLVENNYDLTSTLLSKHGQSYNRLFLGNPSAKLIGVLGKKVTLETEKTIIEQDIGFKNDVIIPHLQTHDVDHRWQTYYSYLPKLNNKLIVTHAQCKNLPKTGYVKVDATSNSPIVKLDHLGNATQRELTLNYIYDAYIKNDTQLAKLGYVYNGPQITKKFIEKSINSLYHYHGTCPVGKVVNKDHKVNNTNNLFISDCSVLSKPWPGSTSVPAAVAGIITANNISRKINNPIFEWTNSHEFSGKTYDIVMKCLNRWRSIITNIPTNKPIQFTFTLSDDLEPGVLGAASLSKYIVRDTLEIKELNENNYYNDLRNRSAGEIFPYSGDIVLNKSIWNSRLDEVDEDNNQRVYYTLLHEIGHVLGIGPLWILYGILLYDEKSEEFFYGGEKGNVEYKKLFPDLNLSYMPVENNGGAGTAIVHPEEGYEEGVSKNNRYYNGIFHPGLDTELMTGWAERGKEVQKLPLSRVTIGMIEDLGYIVDYNAADPFKIDYKNNQK